MPINLIRKTLCVPFKLMRKEKERLFICSVQRTTISGMAKAKEVCWKIRRKNRREERHNKNMQTK